MFRLPVDRSGRDASARHAISLGAGCALFCTALLGYEAPASQAAGGLIEAVFGRPHPVTEMSYVLYPRYDIFRAPPRRLRQAGRMHDIQARRRLIERPRLTLAHGPVHTVVERRRPPAVDAFVRHDSPPFRIQVVSAAMGAIRTDARRPLPRSSARAPDRPQRFEIAAAGGQGRAGGPADVYADPTLRPGDTVVTTEGVRILRSGSRYPFKETDFLSLAQAGPERLANRSALSEIERGLKTPPGRPPADL